MSLINELHVEAKQWEKITCRKNKYLLPTKGFKYLRFSTCIQFCQPSYFFFLFYFMIFFVYTKKRRISGFCTKGFVFAAEELFSGSRNQSSIFRFIIVVRPFVTLSYILYVISLGIGSDIFLKGVWSSLWRFLTEATVSLTPNFPIRPVMTVLFEDQTPTILEVLAHFKICITHSGP